MGLFSDQFALIVCAVLSTCERRQRHRFLPINNKSRLEELSLVLIGGPPTAPKLLEFTVVSELIKAICRKLRWFSRSGPDAALPLRSATSVSKTCLAHFDNNWYSVTAGAVGRPVEARPCADHIEVRQNGRIIGQHLRSFGHDRMIYDPWHYVLVLARKPGEFQQGQLRGFTFQGLRPAGEPRQRSEDTRQHG